MGNAPVCQSAVQGLLPNQQVASDEAADPSYRVKSIQGQVVTKSANHVQVLCRKEGDV